MAEPTSCCVGPGGYCARVDTMFNMPSVHVLDAAWRDRSCKVAAGLCLTVESHPAETGCPSCGVIAVGHGRRVRRGGDTSAVCGPVGGGGGARPAALRGDRGRAGPAPAPGA